MAKLEPIVTQRIDKRITEGKCSGCGAKLELGNDVGSQREQEDKLFAAFDAHKKQKHLHEDFSQAAARVVREATDKV